MVTRRQRHTARSAAYSAGMSILVGLLTVACTGSARETPSDPPQSTTLPTIGKTQASIPKPPSPTAEPAEPTPTWTPNQPCEPGSDPNCSDATGTEGDSFRYIEGYADCLELMGEDEAYGLCTDLDGDGHAGYPDH